MTNRNVLERLPSGFRGPLISPADPGYDEARAVWNGMIDRRPALIARCTGVADVLAALAFAHDEGLRVSVKGGGHGVAGKAVCDDGMVLDLSLMRSVLVDPDAMTAHVGPGVLLGDLDHETQAYGLAVPGGIVSHTGVAGLTLGGGIGYLSRRFGLTVDNLLSAQLVTADGRVLRASEESHPDLFWALRGGGGNFGVVTDFEYRLHEIGPEVLVAKAFFPLEGARPVLEAYRSMMADAPDELQCYALIVNVPPIEPFPAEWQGKPACAIVACWSGDDHAAGRAMLEPICGWGEPILAMVAPMPFADLQSSFDAGVPHGARYYWKSHFLDELTDEALSTMLDHASRFTGSLSLVGLECMGGAVNRIASTATAYPEREAAFALGVWSGWTDPSDDERVVEWTRGFHRAMTPHANGRAYTNYLDQDEDDRVGAAFGANLTRLRQVKESYDPDNFFRLNQNVAPGA